MVIRFRKNLTYIRLKISEESGVLATRFEKGLDLRSGKDFGSDQVRKRRIGMDPGGVHTMIFKIGNDHVGLMINGQIRGTFMQRCQLANYLRVVVGVEFICIAYVVLVI